MARTTLVLGDSLFNRIKKEAVDSRRSLKDTVVDLLTRGLKAGNAASDRTGLRLHSFKSGGASVPVHDRNALFSKMDKKT
ncbi:MAG: hypothetical protein V1913_04005 [Fibrobacterota bacterium]